MQVNDPVAWSVQQQILRGEGEIATAFLSVVEFWGDTADRMLSEAEIAFGREMSPVEAIRLSLPIVESQFGNIDMQYFGQLLLVISMFWEHGAEMATGLTNLEMKVYREAVLLKEAELQQMAETQPEAQEA